MDGSNFRQLSFQFKKHWGKWSTLKFIETFLAILVIFFIVPLFTDSFYIHFFFQAAFNTLIFFSVFYTNEKTSLILSGLTLLLLFVGLDFFGIYFHAVKCIVFANVIYLIFTFIAIVILINKILKASLIDTNLLFGALITYLLSGIFWGKLFFIENIVIPGSFQSQGIVGFRENLYENIYNIQFNLFYYSFTTLSTLGIGDIVPTHHLSKSLTILESMFGQLFIAIVIAKLVSVWQRQGDVVNH